jgi:hypothetical protein
MIRLARVCFSLPMIHISRRSKGVCMGCASFGLPKQHFYVKLLYNERSFSSPQGCPGGTLVVMDDLHARTIHFIYPYATCRLPEWSATLWDEMPPRVCVVQCRHAQVLITESGPQSVAHNLFFNGVEKVQVLCEGRLQELRPSLRLICRCME